MTRAGCQQTMPRGKAPGRLDFARPAFFWTGTALCVAGVLGHLPMYARLTGPPGQHHGMGGMGWDLPMVLGMVLILVGLAACTRGLVGPRRVPEADEPADLRVVFDEDTPLSRAHWLLTSVMTIAVAIDVMKPLTLSFVAPGMAREYGLSSPLDPHGGPPVALLPLFGIGGTVVGSFLWGRFGDRLGRRPAILLASVVFIATSVCGAMPRFSLNLAMCFVMGMSAGGMLPLTFTLLTETVPARRRGWLVVLTGSGIAGGYALTSWMSTLLMPHFGWRVMWLLGLPTGVLLLLLNRWVPESPRFLAAQGREFEARAVLARYGARLLPAPRASTAPPRPQAAGYLRLLGPAHIRVSLPLVLLALGIGLVTYGFQLWIPSDLRRLGFTDVTADTILRDSALLGLPFNLAVAWLYGHWSSKGTLVLLGAVTTVAMTGLAVAGDGVATRPALLHVLLAAPICAASSAIAVIAAYTAEVYPTAVRSHASGLTAAVTKIGGLLMISAVAAALTPPSVRATALLGALPLALATVAILLAGVETRARSLEELSLQALEQGASTSG
ncbi:MFS transporter [Streptomyces melanogenes]|uniref:MFS transporter n=1 Tax=Streptomyces melanogenes TaxID=67326 RepID=UPI00167EA170|nr:MFS transporter [Streptomyces melanogenes]GGP89396.1 MFS sugar transporter [Streptomyces melanogenes]